MKRNEDEGQGKDMKEVQQIKLGWCWQVEEADSKLEK